MKKTSYSLIKDILPGVFEDISRHKNQDQISLEKLWKEMMGGDADKAVVVGCKEGALYINVDCGARLFTMRVRRQKLLSQIQAQHRDINNIVFRIGKVK